MVNRTTKLNRYFFIIAISVVLGLTRYYMYDDSDFNLFSLVDKNKKEIKVNLDHLAKIQRNIDLAGGLNQEISFDEAYFLYDNNLSVFIDARDQDEIEKEGQILNSLTIPVSDIKLVLEGRRNDEGECIDFNGWDFVNVGGEAICGYEDVLNPEFVLDLERVEWVEDDFPDEMKIVNALKKLDKKMTYIVYCGSGDCDKSEDLYGYMKDYMNFEKVMKFSAGWEVWKEEMVAKDAK